jgi:hypothetical protein
MMLSLGFVVAGDSDSLLPSLLSWLREKKAFSCRPFSCDVSENDMKRDTLKVVIVFETTEEDGESTD